MTETTKFRIIDEEGFSRTLSRLAHEILEQNKGFQDLVIIGIQTRGVPLAQRIARILERIGDQEAIPVGILDITFYRDDFRDGLKTPKVRATEIPFSISEKNIVLVDDVIFTGRTVRAAIDAIMDFGRPSRIKLAVLIDRGHREMPIQGDFVGKKIITSPGEEIRVHLKEVDGVDEVIVVEKNKNPELS